MSKSKDMQVALLAPTTSHVLTMSNDDFVENYVQPIEDDTWIRHAEIVHIDQLVETDVAAIQAKRDVLREYMEDHTRAQRAHPNGNKDGAGPVDPVLEGILWQENFIHDYRIREHEHDAAVALSYRSSLVEKFRRRRPSRPAAAPFGEEEPSDSDEHAAAATTGNGKVAHGAAVADAVADVPHPAVAATTETTSATAAAAEGECPQSTDAASSSLPLHEQPQQPAPQDNEEEVAVVGGNEL